MRITESQLRKIIREEIGARPVHLGGMSASIPSDPRYTDRIDVMYDPATDTVMVNAREGTAVGGMDTLSGDSRFFRGEKTSVPAEPRAVAAEIARIVGDSKYLFKRYGKPTKNFRWTTGEKGLSVARVAAALEAVRGE